MAEPAPQVLALFGPTGAGKTRLALALAEALQTEIISADSVQVYRGLDIGSAKPSAAERARVVHHGLDLFDPREQSDAARWVAAVTPEIDRLLAADKVPIVCGGTGLYLRALFLGLAEIPPVPEDVRDAVRARLEADGPAALHAELADLDPSTAQRLDPADRQRIARALEVVLATGTPLSTFLAATPQAPTYPTHIAALVPTRERLHARIAARAAQMMADGLVAEVAALLAAGVPPTAPGLHTLGYREVAGALARGEIDTHTNDRGATPALIEAVARGHRQYAKRQLVWLRGSGMRGLPLTTLDPDLPETFAALQSIATAARSLP